MLYQTKIYDVSVESSVNIDVSKGFNQHLLVGSRNLSSSYNITISNPIERASFKLISSASFVTNGNNIVVAGQTLDGELLEHPFKIEGNYIGGSWNLVVTLDIETIKNLDTGGGFIESVSNTSEISLNVTSGELTAEINQISGSKIASNSIPKSALNFNIDGGVKVAQVIVNTGEPNLPLILNDEENLIDIINVYVISKGGQIAFEEGNTFSIKYGNSGNVSHLLTFESTLNHNEFHKIPETNHTDKKLARENVVLDTSSINIQEGGESELFIIITYTEIS